MSAKSKISPARLAANRANAARSTGPKSAEGKARSRANALKHGLTGAGVVLADDDAALVDEQIGLMLDEFAPTTFAGCHLARRAALLAVRERKAIAHQANRLDARRRHAARDRDARLDALIEAIETSPRAIRRELLKSPEGVDRLLGGLELLLGDLAAPAPCWSPAHHRRLDALFGYKLLDLPWSRPTRFSQALLGDYAAIGAAEVDDVPEEERGDWAMLRLVEAIDAEVKHLVAARVAIDLDALEADRAAALADLEYESDPVLDRAWRYELQASRDFSQTLVDLRRAAALAEPEFEPEHADDPEPVAGDARPTGDLGMVGGSAAEPVGDACMTADGGAVEPKTSTDQQVAADLGSFGEVPVPTPPAPMHGPIPPFHDAEPMPFRPPIRS